MASRSIIDASGAEFFYKGEHYDEGTDTVFDLYTVEDTIDESAAFESYIAAINTTELEKRSWYDCQHLTNLQTFGCNTGHALGSFVSGVGQAAMGGYVTTLLGEAFSSGRDNDSPRSVCLTRDGNNLCVAWATYTSAGLKSGEQAQISSYSVECAASGGSSEFKAEMSNNGVEYICVSNRGTGCSSSVC